MFQCFACGCTGFVIFPPSRDGEVLCAKCGEYHGRFADLEGDSKQPDDGRPAEQPSNDAMPSATAVSGRSPTPARPPLGMAASSAQRLLHRAPRDWETLPDYATLASVRQTLSHLEKSGLVELRLVRATPKREHKWRITEAGRRALRGA